MADNPHHEHLVKELTDQLEPIFSRSPQPVYLYLDDEHKSCNRKFAQMLGYSSPQEWVDNPNPVGDVTQADQDKVIQGLVPPGYPHLKKRANQPDCWRSPFKKARQ